MQELKIKSSEDKALLPLMVKDCLGWSQDIQSYPEVMNYLINNNCYAAYENAPSRFFYDKVKDRIVFAQYLTSNSLSIATGRSLKGRLPKWYKYVVMPYNYFIADCLLAVKHGIKTYIVEDTASACAMSRVGTGLALCGTMWDTLSLVKSIETEDVVICLDADAQNKALGLKRDLEGLGQFKSVKVILLSDDAKYLSKEALIEELNV